MEHLWNKIHRRIPVPASLYPPQIPHGMSRDRTRAHAVRYLRLTAWVMARPKNLGSSQGNIVYSGRIILFWSNVGRGHKHFRNSYQINCCSKVP
jgi:hypothetical protein